MHPIGWDSFGLPAENAAIKRNEHPAEWTYKNIETQAESFRRFGVSFDWSRRLHTSDPEYYRWTQWLFLRFMERGLAYRKSSAVNWCPHDQTVLANEQVVNGRCERCGHEVTKRELTQWYFKITDYADRLLDDMAPLEGHWPERVLTMQRNWIGRSPGAHVDFKVRGADGEPAATGRSRSTRRGRTRSTARPSSSWPPTRRWRPSCALRRSAPSWTPTSSRCASCPTSIVSTASGPRPASTWASSPSTRSTARSCRSTPRTTCWPTTAPARSWRCPRTTSATWISRRRSACRCGSSSTPGSRIRRRPGSPTAGDGVLINSGPFDGLTKADAIAAVTADLEARGLGKGAVNYRLRDWLLSRQRYWGCPIPVMHCPACGDRRRCPTTSCR